MIFSSFFHFFFFFFFHSHVSLIAFSTGWYVRVIRFSLDLSLGSLSLSLGSLSLDLIPSQFLFSLFHFILSPIFFFFFVLLVMNIVFCRFDSHFLLPFSPF